MTQIKALSSRDSNYTPSGSHTFCFPWEPSIPRLREGKSRPRGQCTAASPASIQEKGPGTLLPAGRTGRHNLETQDQAPALVPSALVPSLPSHSLQRVPEERDEVREGPPGPAFCAMWGALSAPLFLTLGTRSSFRPGMPGGPNGKRGHAGWPSLNESQLSSFCGSSLFGACNHRHRCQPPAPF